MWAIRLLNGPQAGQLIFLKPGVNKIGRTQLCDIQLTSNGVSKEHAQIEAYSDRLIVKDLKSSNGTFLNGVRVQQSLAKVGDKVNIHDVFFDIVYAPQAIAHGNSLVAQNTQAPSPFVHTHSQNMGADSAPHHQQNYPQSQSVQIKSFKERVLEYIEQVVLPGVYKLPEVTDFRYVLGGFLLVFIIAVTFLSMIPMSQITKASIEKESRRRALTIARNMANLNQQVFATGIESNLTTQSADLEDGVKDAVIVSQVDGTVLAPATKAGSTPDLPFVHIARRETKELVVQIDSQHIGASVPIAAYNSDLGAFSVKAHAIVIYNMGSLAFDDGRAFSLFIQTLAISSIFGFILFFFLYKLVEYPLVDLNQKLDRALSEKRDNISSPLLFPTYQNLLNNVNSLLSRYVNGEGQGTSFVDKNAEAYNLLQLVGYPCIAINKDFLIIGVNPTFEQVVGVTQGQMQNQAMSSLPDAVLQKSIGETIDQTSMNPMALASGQAYLSGNNFNVYCQCFLDVDGKPAYYLVTLIPQVEMAGGAA